jgi:hypothetical protein
MVKGWYAPERVGHVGLEHTRLPEWFSLALVIVLFVLSIVGCFAPLIAIAATAYVLLQRDIIAKAGPSYLVMGYSAMAISFLYSILMVLFVLFSVASR